MKSLILSACLILGISMLSSTQTIPPDFAMMAYEYRMNGKVDSARMLLDSALTLHPNSSRIWFEKGRCIEWTKTDDCDRFVHVWSKMNPRLRQARRCFRQAARLEPDNARYHFWYSQLDATIGLADFYTPWRWGLLLPDLWAGIRHSKTAVRLEPQNLRYRYELVNFEHFGWLMGGNKNRARAHADTLYSINPVYGLMAHDLISDKKHTYDPLPTYLELEEQDSLNVLLLEQIAWKYRLSDDSLNRTLAFDYYKRILDLNPDNHEALKNLINSLPKDRKSEALPYIGRYQLAVLGGYKYYEAMGMQLYGMYYRSIGDKQAAQSYFEAADNICRSRSGTFIKDITAP